MADLVRAAADVFIESGGYKPTQMEDIAKRVGVSKGTLYLYVESKAALFDLAIRFADSTSTFREPDTLPVPTPDPKSTVEYVNQRVTSDEHFLAFAELSIAPTPDDSDTELEGIVRALYRAIYLNRRALKLVDTCAADHPELAELWYGLGRGGVTSLLVPLLERRIAGNVYANVPDVSLAARFILETCMTWAMHIHWDPHPEPLAAEKIEDTVVHFIRRGLQRGDETP